MIDPKEGMPARSSRKGNPAGKQQPPPVRRPMHRFHPTHPSICRTINLRSRLRPLALVRLRFGVPAGSASGCGTAPAHRNRWSCKDMGGCCALRLAWFPPPSPSRAPWRGDFGGSRNWIGTAMVSRLAERGRRLPHANLSQDEVGRPRRDGRVTPRRSEVRLPQIEAPTDADRGRPAPEAPRAAPLPRSGPP